MNKNDIKQLLEENFAYLTEMTTKEYTLYRKWVDLRKKYGTKEETEDDPFDDFFDDDDTEDEFCEVLAVKSNIWIPESPDDYQKLQPRLVSATKNNHTKTWQILRDFCSSAVWHQSPGRLFKYYVVDDVTGKTIGILSMGSDFIAIGGRDSYIGWTNDDKLLPKGKGKLRNTLMGSTIVPTQPFGYNYNGGKLMALLTASDVIADQWENRYNDKLVGVTTTSLYGGGSMYNRLKYWRKCKSSNGEISIEPSENVWDTVRVWLNENYPELVPKTPHDKMILSHPKHKTLSAIYKLCSVKVPKNNAPRGVYWNELYVDTKEFLRGEIPEVTEKKYDNSVEALSDLWKEKYAQKRVANLIAKSDKPTGWFQGPDSLLFYDDLLTLDWEDVKDKYIIPF